VNNVRLDDRTLHAIECAAHNNTCHPTDVCRLVEEVRYYKAWMDAIAAATGYDPREVPPPPVAGYVDRDAVVFTDAKFGPPREEVVGGKKCVVRDVWVKPASRMYSPPGPNEVRAFRPLSTEECAAIAADRNTSVLPPKTEDEPVIVNVRRVPPDLPRVFTTGAPDTEGK